MVFKASIVTTTVVLALMAAGCGSTTTPTMAPPPTPDLVAGITGLSPALGTTLALGQAVTFTGTAAYTLNSAATGTLVMVIQDQANQILQAPGTQPNKQVAKGSGEATFSQTITLPGTGITTVRLFFALLPTGATSTISNVAVSYPVR